MILKDQLGPPVETSEQLTELTFGVREKDMGLILEILRSKMYRNAIGSICREVASNSRDANREAENLDPIEISIIDSELAASDLAIAFKDEGTGISPERMADVFVNYGASTKRDSDELTGGFGLGAKTPFSYADSFSIVTIFNGVKYTYAAAIEEQKRGKIYLLNSEPTDQRNGTTIIVPIADYSDRRRFEKEVLRATSFWDVPPKYVNFQSSFEFEKVYEFENVLIVKPKDSCNSLLSSGIYALVDGIVYEVDPNSVEIPTNLSRNYLFLLKFSIGEVSVSANREALRYDEETTKKLTERFTRFVEHAKSKLQNEIEKAPSYIEACIRYSEARKSDNSINSCLFDFVIHVQNKYGLEFKWGDRKIDRNLPFREVYLREIHSHGRIDRIETWDRRIQTLPIYFLDRYSLSSLKNRTIFASHSSFLLLEPRDRELTKWRDLKYTSRKKHIRNARALLKDLELVKQFEIVTSNYSTVANTHAPRVVRERQAMVGAIRLPIREVTTGLVGATLVVNSKEIYISRDCKESKKKEIVYFPVKSISESSLEIREMISWAQIVKYLMNVRVIFVSSRNVGHLRGRLKTLDEAIRELKRKELCKITDQDYFSRHEHDVLQNVTRFTFPADISREIQRFENYQSSTFLTAPTQATNKLVAKPRVKTKRKYNGVIPSDFERKNPPSVRIVRMFETLKSIYSRYPLLSFLGRMYLEDELTLEVNRYICLIDQSSSKTSLEKKEERST